MIDHQVLLQRLLDFIKGEFATQVADPQRQWELPLALRVMRGYGIEGLTFAGMQDGVIKPHCQTNESYFHRGDFLLRITALWRGWKSLSN